VNLFATKLGAEAARLLQRYMRTGKPPRSRQLETSLVIRESTAAAPRSARRVARA
jgi:DNA-binding LacI/PurR family transcriptional regulator